MNSNANHSFCESLRKIRTGNNLTQAELAKRIGVSRQQLVYWEVGKNLPSLPNLAVIARALNVTLDTLVFGQVDDA
jgi:transcriptional regulator with XRE-family HTH domain